MTLYPCNNPTPCKNGRKHTEPSCPKDMVVKGVFSDELLIETFRNATDPYSEPYNILYPSGEVKAEIYVNKRGLYRQCVRERSSIS